MRDGVVRMDGEEWANLGLELIALMGVDASIPDDTEARISLTKEASKKVLRDWKLGPDNDQLMDALFRGTEMTVKDRAEAFAMLMEFARHTTKKPVRLLWNTTSPDPVAASIRFAWEPLGIWDEGELEKATEEARHLMTNPKARLLLSTRIAMNPWVARWLKMIGIRALSEQGVGACDAKLREQLAGSPQAQDEEAQASTQGGSLNASHELNNGAAMRSRGWTPVGRRLEYLDEFAQVKVDGKIFDLQSRDQARYCIEYMVAKGATTKEDALLFSEIDVYVRGKGAGIEDPTSDLRIHGYFGRGKLPELRKSLIYAAGRNGKFFLKVD